MAFHTAADIETIFDTDFGDGYLATVNPVTGSDYDVNVLRDKDVEKVDDFGNLLEKTTILHFITSQLPAALVRGDQVTFDSRTYVIETLMKEDTYISSYVAS